MTITILLVKLQAHGSHVTRGQDIQFVEIRETAPKRSGKVSKRMKVSIVQTFDDESEETGQDNA